MPVGKIRSASEPPPSITDRRSANLPDLHGRLATSTDSYLFRLTKPETFPSAGTGTAGSRVGRKLLSDHHAELTPAFPMASGEAGNIHQSGNPQPATSRPSPLVSSQSPDVAHLQAFAKPGPGLSINPPGVGGVPMSPEDKKKAKQARSEQPTSTKNIDKSPAPQISDELVSEVKRLVAGATQDQLQATGVDLTKLQGFAESDYKADLQANRPLLKAFASAYREQSRGGKIFPDDFSKKLMDAFERKIADSAKPAPTKKAGKSGSAGAVKAVNKVPLDQIPGLQDMFLSRAINHLITGELHMLDSMIGDEGCQIRAPFVLDMHKLVQKRMPRNAIDLVRQYREKAEGEQTGVLEQLKELEARRKGMDTQYESAVSDFVGKKKRLEESKKAKSGEYEAMFADLLSAIKECDPKGADYLSHVCSEGAIYWEDVLDPFGLSMLTDRHPVFPNTILAGRKMRQSGLSKDYLVKSAAELVRKEGGMVRSGTKEIGFDKKKVLQTSTSFLTAQSKRESMPAMLLHAIQLHSGAAVTKGKRQLELIPYWETTRLALTHALKEGYPLIVNLRRLTVSNEGSDRQYSGNICKTLFYEPTDEGYRYQPDPSADQQSQGALLFQGYSMLRKGDTGIPGATLPIAPWVFKETPEEFLDGFTKCDVANLMLLGDVGTHHPLNTGGSGSGAYAYGLPGGQAGEYSFDNDPGGWKYVDVIHDLTLSELGSAQMTQQGKEYLTPDFALTDKSKGMVFPDECPVRISGTTPEFNIKEEYQLVKQLGRAAGMRDTMYSKEHKDGTAERVAQNTVPFVSTHILASTFAHENEVSKRFAAHKTRGVTERLDELRNK